MEASEYLSRIGYEGSLSCTQETLASLHVAHLRSVPFENLSIHLGEPIELSLPAIYEKVVARRRGGFCYELNGLFGWLLEQLGFSVERLSARVVKETGIGPEFDHLLLRVAFDEARIADVGFGDSFLEPLPLVANRETSQRKVGYRLRQQESDWILEQQDESSWSPQYLFRTQPRAFEEFAAMCEHHQSSPESSFTQKIVCSRATEHGRVTLSSHARIETRAGVREVQELQTPAQFRAVLEADFGIALAREAPVEAMMRVGLPLGETTDED